MSRSIQRAVIAACLACVLAAAGEPAQAQSGNRGTMVISDGQTTHVLHYSEPDVDLVIAPELIP